MCSIVSVDVLGPRKDEGVGLEALAGDPDLGCGDKDGGILKSANVPGGTGLGEGNGSAFCCTLVLSSDVDLFACTSKNVQ